MSTRRPDARLTLVRAVLLVIVLVIVYLFKPLGKNPPQPPKRPPAEDVAQIVIDHEIAKNVVIRDEKGKVLYRGDVDLTSTIDRIEQGNELTWHENDGEVFGNFEGRLPKKPKGYYHEWVHPTPKLRGAGPQRIITGKEGEKYYSPDHYGHFYLVP